MEVKLAPGARLPTRGSDNAAGYDLYALDAVWLSPQKATLVSTGVSMAIPNGYYGRIAPRSGLALKGIDVFGGVIDSDYRGEIKAILAFSSPDPEAEFAITSGMKIAQIIFEKHYVFDFGPVTEFSDLTTRGEGGFGSTGN